MKAKADRISEVQRQLASALGRANAAEETASWVLLEGQQSVDARRIERSLGKDAISDGCLSTQEIGMYRNKLGLNPDDILAGIRPGIFDLDAFIDYLKAKHPATIQKE